MISLAVAGSSYMTNATDEFMNGLMQIVGNPMYIGLLFIILVIFIIIGLKLSFDIAIVTLIPAVFIASVWIEPLRLIFAIIIGLLIGIGVLRLIGRR